MDPEGVTVSVLAVNIENEGSVGLKKENKKNIERGEEE